MKNLILILFIVFTIKANPNKNIKNDIMIVMTYNIRYAGDEKAERINSWNNRKELVARMIRFHHADLIGVQEALINQLEDLIKLLPEYRWIGVGRDDGKQKGEFSAILYRKDRFELLQDSTFWLSKTPDGPSKGWDAAYPRIVTFAKFKDKSTKKIFYQFNTHLDNVGETARENSAKLIRERVDEIEETYPLIITGDFNVNPNSEVYQIMVDTINYKRKIYDSEKISVYPSYGSKVSFNDFGKNVLAGNKIDYIFVNDKIKVLQHGIIGDTFNGQYPSDHMPVIVEVIIK
ncbi:MAG: endonuclease/exonuclease/phosphatase family protein [Ignavibacteriaceae bacterium]